MNTIADYLHRKASVNAVPLSGVFELSPVCNFNCKMCYVRMTPQQIAAEGKSLIDWQQWLELAKQCRDAGTLYLLLTGGEPFLYPNFRKLYEALHEMGFLLSINSNASLIDEETMQWLKSFAPSRMNVTLYGASRKTYRRICGNPDGYDRAERAIRWMKEAGIPVVINASMIPENAEDIEAIIKFGHGLGLNTRVSTYMFPPVRREKENTDSRFTPEVAAKMFMRRSKCQFSPEALCKMFREQENKGFEGWGQTQEHMNCRAGRSSYWISWNGAMTACGLFDFPIIKYPFNEPFLQCWRELTALVRTTPVLEQCTNCDLRQICNPCAATVHAECGDVNGKAEYLCEMARLTKQEIKAYLSEVTDV